MSDFRSSADSKSFFETNWSDVERGKDRGEILNRLVERYRPFIEKRATDTWKGRIQSGELDDYIQSFLLKLLEGRVVKNAQREKGTFRGFLKVCFDNHVRDSIRSKRTQRELQFSTEEEAELKKLLPDHDEAMEHLEHSCRVEILRLAVRLIREKCQQKQSMDIWNLVEDQILGPISTSEPPLTQDELISKYQFASRNVVSGKMCTARKWFRAAVVNAIREYADPEDVEDELRDFCRALPEVAAALREHSTALTLLHSHLHSDLDEFDSVRWHRSDVRSLESLGVRTYFDLLAHPSPPLDHLHLVKSFARSVVQKTIKTSAADRILSAPPFDRLTAKFLYVLSIAVARTKASADASFSTLTNDEVVENLQALYRDAKKQIHIEQDYPEIAKLVRDQIQAVASLRDQEKCESSSQFHVA